MASEILLSGGSFVLAGERLTEFSDMVKDINAEAKAPGGKDSKDTAGAKTPENKETTGAKASVSKGSAAKDKDTAGAKTQKSMDTTVSGDRFNDFVSIVRDAEKKAGVSDSDPESDRVIRTGDDESYADPDGRLAAMAAETKRIEKEMEKKYGPVIEDRVVKSPEEYDDGDRVVATENTAAESSARLKGIHFSGFDSTSNKKNVSVFKFSGDELKGGSASFEDSGDDWISDVFKDRDSLFYDTGDTKGNKGRSLGIFKLTAYDACLICCGKTDGITATGTKAGVGRTIAVDPSVIPFGKRVMINGHIYTAEDSGSKIKGNRIDIFMSTHEEAKQFGVKQAEVFLVE